MKTVADEGESAASRCRSSLLASTGDFSGDRT
jgi:hypothetical protein